MNNASINVFESQRKLPWISLLVLVVFFIVGLFVGQFVGVVVSLLFSGYGLPELMEIVSPPLTAEKRIPLLLIQGFGAFGGFILGGWAYMKMIERKPPGILFRSIMDMREIILVIFIVFTFMMANSFFIEWNANLVFPSFMKGFESWARAQEEELRIVTEFLISFDSRGQFLLGMLVIAVIPAIGEELLFRGIIQNKLAVYLKNGHVAIWVTAILFSGFHLQFFGFVPRMLLGVLFGYMYYWSANLWIPVIAHFINNAFTLTMLYLYQLDITGIDIENQDPIRWEYLILFGFLTVFALYYYRSLTMSVDSNNE